MFHCLWCCALVDYITGSTPKSEHTKKCWEKKHCRHCPRKCTIADDTTRKWLEIWSRLKILREMRARKIGLPPFCIRFFRRTFLLWCWCKKCSCPFARCFGRTSSQKEQLMSKRLIKRISGHGCGLKKSLTDDVPFTSWCHKLGEASKAYFCFASWNPLQQREGASTDQSCQSQVFVLLRFARPTLQGSI